MSKNFNMENLKISSHYTDGRMKIYITLQTRKLSVSLRIKTQLTTLFLFLPTYAKKFSKEKHMYQRSIHNDTKDAILYLNKQSNILGSIEIFLYPSYILRNLRTETLRLFWLHINTFFLVPKNEWSFMNHILK